MAGGDMVFETVPQLTRRLGDSLMAGQNNATILLGRDRVDGLNTGYGRVDSPGAGVGAGAIHLVVGRASENPSIIDDRASVYLSSKADPDIMAGTDGIGAPHKAESAVIMRADCVRITARNDMKLSVGKAYITLSADGGITLEGDISLGKSAAQRMIRGDAFALFWSTLVIPTPAGPSSPPPPLPDSVFSPRVKVG